jgi:hypothetical protein
MDNFENKWMEIRKKLHRGQIIKNWTVYSDYLGDTMKVVDVGLESISIQSPRAENLQTIPKSDFESVWGLWSDYKAGKVRRSDLRDITRFSKYIISLLHWSETKK